MTQTLDQLAQSNLDLQKSLLAKLAADRDKTPAQPGYAAQPPAIQQALSDLPYLTCSTMIRANTGPPLVAAAAYVATADPQYRADSITTFDELISVQQQPNGALFSQSTGGDIDTMFFAVNLGTAALLLNPTPGETANDWAAVTAKAADYLISNKNLTWYTNGNICIGNALVMALAYRLAGTRNTPRPTTPPARSPSHPIRPAGPASAFKRSGRARR
jgi:hypothetical protein